MRISARARAYSRPSLRENIDANFVRIAASLPTSLRTHRAHKKPLRKERYSNSRRDVRATPVPVGPCQEAGTYFPSHYADHVSEASTAPTSDSPEKASIRPRWLDFGILIATVPMALAALRIVLYSGGDPALMRVLVETLDVTTLLLGTILPILPALFWLAIQPLVVDMSLARQLLEKGAPRRKWWIGLALTLILFYLLVGPWPETIQTFGHVLIGLAAAVVLVSAIALIRGRKSGLSWREAAKFRLHWRRDATLGKASHLLIAPVVVIGVILAMPEGFWLPRESITTAEQTTTGYVLETKEGWATVMTEERTILRIPAPSITARLVCDQGEYTSLITVLLRLESPPKEVCK